MIRYAPSMTDLVHDGTTLRVIAPSCATASRSPTCARASADTRCCCVHGWPETKRIWWRNVAPLAAAGFEVIVPDLRGFGDSDLAADGRYDIAAHARDLHALVHDVLGHARWRRVAGDLGGACSQDLALRFPGFVERQCLFNTVLPSLARGLHRRRHPATAARHAAAADYFIRQATDADGAAAELDSPGRRRRYIAEFYGHRFWAAPGQVHPADVDFMTRAVRRRARNSAQASPTTSTRSATAAGRRAAALLRDEPDADAGAVRARGPRGPGRLRPRAEVAFPERIGPLVVPGAGHFLQWERATVLNQALRYFLADRLAR